MKHLNTRTQFGFSILPFALCLFLILLSACDGGSGKSDEASSDTSDETSSDTGSIAFSLAWEEDTTSKSGMLQAALAPSGDVCVDYGIDTISAEVYNSSDTEVASASWPCSDHGGTISDVPTGSGMYLIVEGTVAGSIDWQGQTTTFTVSAGQTTDAGTVTLDYIGDDATPPDVTSISPANGATGVALNAAITATFSEDMVLASINTSSFTLETGTTTISGPYITYYPSTRSATFNLPTDISLSYSTSYTATITTDVQDLADNQMEQDYTWSFTTISNIPPTGSINSPSDASTYTEGEEIGFSGSGSDPEDGHLSGLVWTSSRDGQIGTGEYFTRDDLSVGIHIITFTVTDSAGATESASITLTVRAIGNIGSVDTPGSAYGVYVSGPYAYVADLGGGFRSLESINKRL